MPYIPDHLMHDDQWSAVTYIEVITLKEIIMAQVDRLEALIKAEVGDALATMQQRVDDALARADASDTERDAVRAEFDAFQGRVDNLADRVEEEGLFGQDDTTPEPSPVEPGPDEPVLPDTEPEPVEPGTEPPADNNDEGTDPGAVTF